MTAGTRRQFHWRALRKGLTRLMFRAAIFGARRAVRKSDRWLISRLEWLERTIRRFSNKIDPTPVRELKELVRDDPQGHEVLRKVILDCRVEQAVSMFSGIFKYHVGSTDKLDSLIKVNGPKPKASAASALTVAVIGDGFEAESMAREYGARGCRVLRPKNVADAKSAVDGLEILNGRGVCELDVSVALTKGIAVSIHHAFFKAPETWRRFYEMADSYGTPFRVFYPYLYYPPAQKVKALILDDAIGEVSTIRIRATCGGRGGTLAYAPPPAEDYLEYPAFDHFILLSYLGGGLERAGAYLNPMDPVKGGQGVVDCKYLHPGRYGLLECAYAPQLYLRSDFLPHDLDVEVAGTDGIIWLRRGMAQRIQAAAVYMRVGRQAVTFGVESGLKDEWDETYRQAAEDFLARLRGGSVLEVDAEEIVSAYNLKNKATAAAQSGDIIRL